jgi:hypothetical protein
VRDAVWAQDATHLGRLKDGSKVEAEGARDRATLRTVILAVGAPATGEDLVARLEEARRERGGLPLVWQSDRGSANRSRSVRAYLEENQVIHLLSRVHTPTDNPVAEHAHGEYQGETGLGDGVALACVGEATGALDAARRRLDEARLRASLGFRTAAEADAALPRADAQVDRARFYDRARSAMERAGLGHEKARDAQKAEQDAVWTVLEEHGLARVVRGKRRLPRRRSAGVPARPARYHAGGVPT